MIASPMNLSTTPWCVRVISVMAVMCRLRIAMTSVGLISSVIAVKPRMSQKRIVASSTLPEFQIQTATDHRLGDGFIADLFEQVPVVFLLGEFFRHAVK